MKKTYFLQLVAALLLSGQSLFSQCLNQSVTPVSASVVCAGSGTIALASSELGMNYYVRNDATNSVVTGPVAGTGGSLVLGTGHMSASTIYNVYGVKSTGALSFDGIDDYVAIGSAFNSNVDFTWEFWIKTGADGTIFSKSDATGNWSTGAKSLYIQNGKIRFEVFGIAYFETYNVYNDNNWHHVAVTAEMSYLGTPDDRVRIYVDGAFSIEKNNWDINGNSETGLINKIGYTNSNYPAASAFNGIIDDVKIWNTAHTATDVALDMTSCLTGSETGLVGYYRFEDGSGTTATDMAGNDNPGTLTNMASTAWVYGRDECGSCNVTMTQKPVFVVTNIVDQNLSAATLTLCSNISTSINAASSENGVNYYLRDNSSNAVISGPYAGTGSALSLTTGIVANTTTFNVLANRVSGGLNFDGVDDYVMANETSAIENLGMNPFTMESWINPNSVTGVRSIIRKDGDYNLYLNNGNVVAEVFPAGGIGGSYYQATTTTTVTPGKWTYVAATWDGTNIAIFINYVNSPVTTGSSSSTLTGKFCIGGATTAGKTFDGKLDELRLWSAARSVIQLTANIGACLTGTETSLLAYYQFEDGRGSTVLTDKISAGNNGVLVNMDNINAWKGGVENCGCSLTLSQKPVITVNSSPTVSVNSGAICSGNSFIITPSGANSYTISGGNFTVTPSASTSYSVTGSNTAGCVSAPAIAMVTVNITPTISVNSASICSGNTAVITPTGAASYTITGNNFTVTPAATTSYSVSGSSTAGCVASNTAVAIVSVNITPTVSVNSGSLCSGNVFTISPAGASTYTISGGNFTVTPSANTSYSVTGTATNGCVSSNTAVASITVNATPTLAVNSVTVCSGTQVTLTPTGAANYTITGNSFTVTPASTTSYSVIGTSSAGCVASNTAVATVSVNSTPTVSVNSGSLCSGSSFTIQPAGAAAYTITGGNYTVTPSVTTSYSITGSNGACISQNTAVATITVNTTPTVTVNSATICSGNSVAIVPTGGANYSITGNSFTVSPLNTTSYSVTATSTAACVSNVAVATILVNTSPTISVNSGAVCAGSPFIILPSGANTYTVTGNSFTVTPSSTTSYSVSGTAANGCVAMSPAVAVVTVNALPVITVNGGAVCPGNTFTLMPGGASSYTYSGGSNIVAPTITSSYTITGSSAAGCPASNTAVATVSVVNTLSVFVTGAVNICSGQSTTLTANGAATYTWSTFSQGNMITIAPAVTSTYMVVGASGSCSNTALVTVSVSPIPTISVNSGSICAGGIFTIMPSGATSYTYSGGTPVVSPGITTTFSVIGSSGPGCVSTNTAMSLVTVSPLPNVTASVSQSLICLGQPAVLMATGAANYTWSDSQTGGSVTVSPPVSTIYTVTGISASGCTNTAVVALMVSPCTNLQSVNGNSLVFGVYPNPNNGQFVVEAPEHVTIIIQNTIGQVVYSTVSDGPATPMNISSLANGIYFVKAVSGSEHQTIKFIKE